MRTISLAGMQASAIVAGCMRLGDSTVEEADTLVHTALELGINLFDHADIYGQGQCETIFGKVLAANPGLRDRMLLQSKCGIRKGYYDFSCAHIVSSVEASLQRLQTDHLDLLLLHRPDALAEQEDFARAVQTLKAQGKVLAFGVSNMNPAQIRLLERWSGEKMAAVQMQLSLVHAGLVTAGINVNGANPEGVMYDGSLLPYAEEQELALQAWSPLQDRKNRRCFLNNPDFPELNRYLSQLAEKYNVTPAAVALAWILRIPGKIQTVVGTVSPQHLEEAVRAAEITLTRPQWYGLYRAAGYALP